jgi:choline dehydrogenase-like flavoprotein
MDINGIPITNLYYKKSKKTLLTAKRMLEEMGNLFVNENLGRVAIRDEIENLDYYESLGAYHHMGGTRIGKNKNDSVVDSNLRLHNSKNLFITGSSVFTTGGYANPTYTIVKLSLRLADELEKQLKRILVINYFKLKKFNFLLILICLFVLMNKTDFIKDF